MYYLEREICGYGFFGVLTAGFAGAATVILLVTFLAPQTFPAGKRATDVPLMGIRPKPSQWLIITLGWKKNLEMESVKGGFEPALTWRF